jgi:hypothetical protein
MCLVLISLFSQNDCYYNRDTQKVLPLPLMFLHKDIQTEKVFFDIKKRVSEDCIHSDLPNDRKYYLTIYPMLEYCKIGIQ